MNEVLLNGAGEWGRTTDLLISKPVQGYSI